MKYSLTIPPSVETVTTGFAMGAEKQIGKNVYRIEIFTHEPMPRFLKNGARIDDPNTLPKPVIGMANAVIGFYNKTQELIDARQ